MKFKTPKDFSILSANGEHVLHVKAYGTFSIFGETFVIHRAINRDAFTARKRGYAVAHVGSAAVVHGPYASVDVAREAARVVLAEQGEERTHAAVARMYAWITGGK